MWASSVARPTTGDASAHDETGRKSVGGYQAWNLFVEADEYGDGSRSGSQQPTPDSSWLPGRQSLRGTRPI